MEALSPEAAVSIVAVVRRTRANIVLAAALGVGGALVAWLAGASWMIAAAIGCVTFPVAARLMRALWLVTLRRRFARDPAEAQRQADAAWAAASPGQRAALEMLRKKSG